jgi:hypothetical protein
MTEAERYQAVQHQVKDLLDKAANDQSPAGIVGFGSVLLAAKLYARNEQVHSEKLEEVQHETIYIEVE